MITGMTMIVVVLGGAILLDQVLPEDAVDKLLHILRFDEGSE